MSISLNVDALKYCVKAACSVKRSEWSISLEKCYKMPLQSLFFIVPERKAVVIKCKAYLEIFSHFELHARKKNSVKQAKTGGTE